MKLDKIEKEMQRTREKISDLQNHLKELGTQKTEQENPQIVSLVRSLDISPAQLKAFLQAAAVAGFGGGAFYYFKILKPKQDVRGGTDLADLDELNFDGGDDYSNMDADEQGDSEE